MEHIDNIQVDGVLYAIGGKPQEVTYAVLKSMADGGTLVTGRSYRITDYVTSFKTWHSAGHAFDLIVTATAPDKLSEIARAALHEGDTYFANSRLEAWLIWYHINNDETVFLEADASGKGVIYRMIDEWNNDVDYDFKNAQTLVDESEFPEESYAGMYYYTFTVYDSGALHDGSLNANNSRVKDNTIRARIQTSILPNNEKMNMSYLICKTNAMIKTIEDNRVTGSARVNCSGYTVTDNEFVGFVTVTATQINNDRFFCRRTSTKITAKTFIHSCSFNNSTDVSLNAAYRSTFTGDGSTAITVPWIIYDVIVRPDGGIIYPGGCEIPSAVLNLTSSSTSEEISTAIGGLDGMKKIVKAANDGNLMFANLEFGDFFVKQYLRQILPVDTDEQTGFSILIEQGIYSLTYTASSATFTFSIS